MKESELKVFLEIHGLTFDEFKKWIAGHTISTEDGEDFFYFRDIRNFFLSNGITVTFMDCWPYVSTK